MSFSLWIMEKKKEKKKYSLKEGRKKNINIYSIWDPIGYIPFLISLAFPLKKTWITLTKKLETHLIDRSVIRSGPNKCGHGPWAHQRPVSSTELKEFVDSDVSFVSGMVQ
jgi:hypothetical protein